MNLSVYLSLRDVAAARSVRDLGVSPEDREGESSDSPCLASVSTLAVALLSALALAALRAP